mgnify:CR=1 FL=1
MSQIVGAVTNTGNEMFQVVRHILGTYGIKDPQARHVASKRVFRFLTYQLQSEGMLSQADCYWLNQGIDNVAP